MPSTTRLFHSSRSDEKSMNPVASTAAASIFHIATTAAESSRRRQLRPAMVVDKETTIQKSSNSVRRTKVIDTQNDINIKNETRSSNVATTVISNDKTDNVKKQQTKTYRQTVAFDPTSVLHPTFAIPYPKALSPSSISEFKKCPQSYLFQYLLGMKQPTTPVLAKGSMCHAALERIFDIDPQDRSLLVLQNLFRSAWSEHRYNDPYKTLFDKEIVVQDDDDIDSNDVPVLNDADMTIRRRDIEAEAMWGREGLQLLDNYWKMEDASKIVRPNPVSREIWVSAKLKTAANNRDASTSYPSYSDPTTATNDSSTFLVRGIVDRLDMVRCNDNRNEPVALRLIDYKSGKAPDLKYTAQMNDKIRQEAFDQLLIYALLLREQKRGASSSTSSSTDGIPLRFLRLFYLTSHNSSTNKDATEDDTATMEPTSKAVYWDMDLGATPEERDVLLDNVQNDLIMVWQSITDMINEQNLQTFYGCNRSFCHCHKCRSLFPPGSVWEPSL